MWNRYDATAKEGLRRQSGDSCKLMGSRRRPRLAGRLRPKRTSAESWQNSRSFVALGHTVEKRPSLNEHGGRCVWAEGAADISVVPDRTSAVLDRTTVVLHRTSVAPDRNPVVPDRTSVVPDRTSVVPDRTSVVPDRTSVVLERTHVVPDRTPVVPDRTSVVPDRTSLVPAANEHLRTGIRQAVPLLLESHEALQA